MKKIGLVTLNGYKNYGNRLQNYALQNKLEEFNYQVETIWIETQTNKEFGFLNSLKNHMINPKNILKKIYQKLYLDNLNLKREDKFRAFSRRFIIENQSIDQNDLFDPLIFEKYSFFVVGSDQVWNPYYTNSSPLYFLSFAPKEKRIAYAPSFGISELPECCEKDYKQFLSDFEFLSVREDAGADLIKQLTDRDVDVLPDPTLLLTKEEWISISKSYVDKPKTDYILTYFLGAVSKEARDLINKIEKKYNFKIVNLAESKYRKYYLADPSEFLDFINSAKLFFTDSFHGTVFSILFHTPFVVTNRNSKVPSMNSRINTLLSTYEMEDRHISNLIHDNVFDINFSHVEDILNTERDRANKFLMNALNS